MTNFNGWNVKPIDIINQFWNVFYSSTCENVKSFSVHWSILHDKNKKDLQHFNWKSLHGINAKFYLLE